jgi:thiamine-phosphate pyrophosphorylase
MRHKIYALFDFALNEAKGYDLDRFLHLPKVQEAEILQYRDKVNSQAVKRENILYLKRGFKGKLIANDDVELALLVDGLHVGQEDLLRYETDPLKAAVKLREILEDRILGLSTHNEEEISEANKMPLDYIGLGAYRNTSTKSVTNILGERLSILAASSSHPVAAIGGVKKCDNIAHVSYLVLGSDLYED